MDLPDLDRLGFDIPSDVRDLRDMMLRYGREQLAPGAAGRDRDHSFPKALIDDLARMGAMAMKTAPEDDGPGISNLGYALAVEAIARADASVAVVMVASNLSAAIIAQQATEAQRVRFLRPAARGECGALSFALTEPGAGSDAAGITTTAHRDGADWVISGTKQWITGGSHAELFLVFAKTPDLGERAVTGFVVEAGTPGFTLGRIEDKMGLRSSGTAQLFFDDVRVPDANVIGDPGKGLQAALSGIAPSRVAIAALSLGIAEQAFALGRDYASQRKAFGQPVSAFQNSRFVLANARTALDQAWLLMLRAAVLLDRGTAIRAEASMAKLAASETCDRVVDAMLQLHGGNGYSQDYEIERLYRDARVMRIFEGTSEVQREVIARDVLSV